MIPASARKVDKRIGAVLSKRVQASVTFQKNKLSHFDPTQSTQPVFPRRSATLLTPAEDHQRTATARRHLTMLTSSAKRNPRRSPLSPLTRPAVADCIRVAPLEEPAERIFDDQARTWRAKRARRSRHTRTFQALTEEDASANQGKEHRLRWKFPTKKDARNHHRLELERCSSCCCRYIFLPR